MLMIMTLLLVSLVGFSQSQRYYELKNYYRGLGYSIGNEKYQTCIQGASFYSYMNFSPSSEYVIVAMSDDSDVLDVDIFMYYSDGSLFMKDSDSSNLAIISFSCSSYVNNTIIYVKNYSSTTPNYASTLRFFIAYK